MAELPLVTVVTLSYNTGRYVVEALDCVHRQSYPNIQLIIIDDGSSDDSVSLIKDWLSRHTVPQCRLLIVNKTNEGIPRVFNRAISEATGQYITWISDDLWDGDRVAKTIELFERLPKSTAVMFGDVEVINQDAEHVAVQTPYNNLLGLSFPAADALAPSPSGHVTLSGELVRRALFYKCFFAAPTVTVRKQLYDTVGRYDPALYSEDIDCWFRASEHFDFVYFQQQLVRYRIHQTNASSGRDERYLQTLLAVLYRYLDRHNDPASQAAVKRHIREEAYRISRLLLARKAWRQAARYMRRYYCPNLQLTRRAAKESARLLLDLAASMLR